MDVHSKAQRSYNMSKIRGKDTKPELIIKRLLWARGYRYRLHKKDLPGKPDIVFPRYHSVIFVNGCYWHRHGCKDTSFPAKNKKFWALKFLKNVERDQRNYKLLKKDGWRVLIVWECQIKKKIKYVENRLIRFLEFN